MDIVKETQKYASGFDFENDPICQEHFKPFIEDTLTTLKNLDKQRLKRAHTEYIFHEHAPRVAKLTEDFCLHLGMDEKTARNMFWATLPHDLGKFLVEDERFENAAHIWEEFKDKPSDDIFDLRRTHGDLGAEFMEECFARNTEAKNHPFFSLMHDIAQKHHESLDGNGPLKIEAAEITAPVRLVAIIEAFDGYTIKRAHFPQNRDTSPAGALVHMAKKTEQFDQDLFRKFSSFIKNRSAPQPPAPRSYEI